MKVVIYDRTCGLCNHAVNFLLRVDKRKVFHYTSLQGKYVKTLDLDTRIDSIVFYDEGKVYTKSTAVLTICHALGGMWVLMKIFYLLPRFLRDFLYDVVAKYRFTLFPKKPICRIVKKEELAYFLD